MEIKDLEQFIVSLDAATPQETAGIGSFGAVYKSTLNGAPCAAKKLHEILTGYGENLPVNKEDQDCVVKNFISEIRLLSQLKHPNIVQFLGVCGLDPSKRDPDLRKIALVMEHMEMSLEQFIKRNKGRTDLGVKVCILKDAASGVSHLHSKGIIHRDLNSGNVLLTSNLRAKVADLGISRIMNRLGVPNSIGTMTRAPGALDYMPPEAVRDNPSYGPRLDCFSFGHLMLYLFVEEYPRPVELVFEELGNVERDGIQIQRRKSSFVKLGVTHPLYKMVCTCLNDKPENRWDMKTIRQMLEALINQKKYEIPQLTAVMYEKEAEQRRMTETTKELENLVATMKTENQRMSERTRELEFSLATMKIENEKQHEISVKNSQLSAEIDQLRADYEDKIKKNKIIHDESIATLKTKISSLELKLRKSQELDNEILQLNTAINDIKEIATKVQNLRAVAKKVEELPLPTMSKQEDQTSNSYNADPHAGLKGNNTTDNSTSITKPVVESNTQPVLIVDPKAHDHQQALPQTELEKKKFTDTVVHVQVMQPDVDTAIHHSPDTQQESRNTGTKLNVDIANAPGEENPDEEAGTQEKKLPYMPITPGGSAIHRAHPGRSRVNPKSVPDFSKYWMTQSSNPPSGAANPGGFRKANTPIMNTANVTGPTVSTQASNPMHDAKPGGIKANSPMNATSVTGPTVYVVESNTQPIVMGDPNIQTVHHEASNSHGANPSGINSPTNTTSVTGTTVSASSSHDANPGGFKTNHSSSMNTMSITEPTVSVVGMNTQPIVMQLMGDPTQHHQEPSQKKPDEAGTQVQQEHHQPVTPGEATPPIKSANQEQNQSKDPTISDEDQTQNETQSVPRLRRSGSFRTRFLNNAEAAAAASNKSNIKTKEQEERLRELRAMTLNRDFKNKFERNLK